MLEILILFLGLSTSILAQMEGFIVGGNLAAINRYPHSAFLLVSCVSEETGKRINWICGSSLINQKLLITAGHCLYPCGPGTRISVNMGDENRQNGIVRSASGFIIHENYVQKKSACDIGMLKMARPVVFSSRIKRVAIMKHPPYNEQASLAGWGLTNEKTKAQGINLKEVDQKVWKHSACVQMFGKLPSGTICASSKKRESFAAQGDSGSALVVRGYIQIGLVSYKIPDLANNVIIYTDVGYYYEWIKYNAQRLYCFKELNR